jgi:hypothetical protein
VELSLVAKAEILFPVGLLGKLSKHLLHRALGRVVGIAPAALPAVRVVVTGKIIIQKLA